MRQIQLIGVLVVILLGAAASGCSPAKELPRRLIARPLTVHEGMMELQLGGGLQLVDAPKADLLGRLRIAVGDGYWRYGLTDKVSWSIPSGLRYAVADSHGQGTDVALDFGLLPIPMVRRGTLLVSQLGVVVKMRLSQQLWVNQATNLVVLRHFDGEFFIGGSVSASFAQQVSDVFSVRLGVLASRALALTTLTAREVDSMSVIGRAMWALEGADGVDLHWTVGGRVTITETPTRVPFTTIGFTLRW